MNIEKLKTIFQEKGIVRFKMYGLDYTIEKVESGIIIYADLYSNKKTLFQTIDEILKLYYIYNENIESNELRLQNIN